MDKIQYLTKALSKDAYRPNLTRIYKDKQRLVATDGHRLHYVETEPSELKGYLDGYDGEFPDYQQVFLKEKTEVILSFSSDHFKKLKALSDLAKAADKKSPIGRLYISDESVIIRVKTSDIEASYIIERDKKSDDWNPIEPMVIGVNLSYLLDAMSPLSKAPFGKVSLGLHSPSSPIEITNHVPAQGLYHAVVMPMKLPEKTSASATTYA